MALMVDVLAKRASFLEALVAAVEAGEEVVVSRGGKPVAKLVAYAAPGINRVPGVLASDPAWRDWSFDPAVFAPCLTDEDLEEQGWPT